MYILQRVVHVQSYYKRYHGRYISVLLKNRSIGQNEKIKKERMQQLKIFFPQHTGTIVALPLLIILHLHKYFCTVASRACGPS